MNLFFLDASALAKRYVQESGTSMIDYLFGQILLTRITILFLGALEVISILVRKKNQGRIGTPAFAQALIDFRAQVLQEPALTKITATDPLAIAAIPLIERHSLNATDAVLLQSAIDLAATLRTTGDDLVLVGSDQRLLRAAQAEGLLTFDPETQDQPVLDALLQP